jgi:hypothetical protein
MEGKESVASAFRRKKAELPAEAGSYPSIDSSGVYASGLECLQDARRAERHAAQPKSGRIEDQLATAASSGLHTGGRALSGGAAVRLSENGGKQPVWSRDGRESF